LTNQCQREPLALLIDTDTASDDAVALVLAAASGLGRIVAVTTVAGNVAVAQATRNAIYTLELAGAGNVPVHQGCDRPLVRPLQTAEHIHGTDGMGEADLPPPSGVPHSDHAIDALLHHAGAHPAGSLTLVTLGPLTNIAAALAHDRNLLSQFRHVYCMAGVADGVGNVTSTAEYNVWVDPEAAAIVLDAARADHVTLIGWDVARRDAVVTPADRQTLQSLGTPLGAFADRINQTLQEWANTSDGLSGYDLPDPIAMAIALRPALAIESEPVNARVALADETRGQLLIDRRHNAPPPNVTVVRRADEAGFKALLFNTCATPAPQPTEAATGSTS
jgi:purine nucleosidase